MECCRLPPSSSSPLSPSSCLLLPSNRSHVFLRALLPCLYSSHLAATPSPPCSVPDRTLLRSRSPPPLSAIRRRGRFHSRFCLAGAARKTCNTSSPLCPTDRPREAPLFQPPVRVPLSALVACFSYRTTRESSPSRNARVLPLLVLKRIFILCARAPTEAAVAARLPSRLAAAAGLLVLVVISIGRRSGRGERRQCAATPISQSRRIDWAIEEEEEERLRRSYLLEDEEAFEVFAVRD